MVHEQMVSIERKILEGFRMKKAENLLSDDNLGVAMSIGNHP